MFLLFAVFFLIFNSIFTIFPYIFQMTKRKDICHFDDRMLFQRIILNSSNSRYLEVKDFSVLRYFTFNIKTGKDYQIKQTITHIFTKYCVIKDLFLYLQPCYEILYVYFNPKKPIETSLLRLIKVRIYNEKFERIDRRRVGNVLYRR